MSNIDLNADPTAEEQAEAEKFLAELPNLSLDKLQGNLDEPIAMYLQEVAKIKPLTSSEEQKLLIAKENGDEAAQRILIERNLGLVIYVASKYIESGVDFLDLVLEGNIGLLRAVENYRKDKGYEFQPFLFSLIRRSVINRVENPSNLDMSVSPINLATTIATGDVEEPTKTEQSLQAQIEAALEFLTESERQVIRQRFGLLDGENLLERQERSPLLKREKVRAISAEAVQVRHNLRVKLGREPTQQEWFEALKSSSKKPRYIKKKSESK